MKIGIISFTARGAALCALLYEKFQKAGDDCQAYVPERFLRPEWRRLSILKAAGTVTEWAGQQFEEGRALVFVGAAGIAVRAIAPWVKDKFSDPPVVVVDELGHFVIPLLSGHVGGANELAERIAGWLFAVPVVTTATDRNGLFAVDVFAARNKMAVTDREAAKHVSAALLAGEQVGFFDDVQDSAIWKEMEDGQLPRGLCRKVQRWNVWVTVREPAWALDSGCASVPASDFRCASVPASGFSTPSFLRLVPRVVVLGLGCRKGIGEKVLSDRVARVLHEKGIDERAVKALATIDIKGREPAVLRLAEDWGLPIRTYSAEVLGQVKGSFSESEFVKEQVKVGNVCERAACAGGGRLIVHKQAGDGITVAAALELPGVGLQDAIGPAGIKD